MAGSEAVDQQFREGIAAAELRLQQCRACHQHQFYPRVVCSHCAGTDLAWTKARGEGAIASYTVVHRAVSRDYTAPYVIALVDLFEGVRLMTHIVDVEPSEVFCGMPVSVKFQPVGTTDALPVFAPLR